MLEIKFDKCKYIRSMKKSFSVDKFLCLAILPLLYFFVPNAFAEIEAVDAVLESKMSSFERVKAVYNENESAVVKVLASKTSEEGKQFLLVGSGFFIDKQGHILTNATIVFNADSLWVDFKGIPSKAFLVGLDPLTNIAVLEVEAKNLEHGIVDMQTSSRLPEIAESLLMVSCELGQDVSPNVGLITGHNIRFGDKILPTAYLRTSIPIFGGSVGAPVFSLQGEFKGIAAAALPELNGSFVLPARAVNRVKDDILLTKKVAYGWFGLVSREISDNVNGTRVIVDIVTEKGPAWEAGFRVGDIILGINGKKVKTDRDLRWETFFVRPGEIATLKVRRQNEEFDLEIQVGRNNNTIIETQSLNVNIKIQQKKEDDNK